MNEDYCTCCDGKFRVCEHGTMVCKCSYCSLCKPNLMKEQFVTGAVRDSQDTKGNPHLIRYALLERLAQVMKRGATKYSSRNWEKGMPVERCYDSAFRHLTMFMEEQITGKKMGEAEDDHLAQCVFNCMAMMVILEGIEDGTYPQELGVNYDASESDYSHGSD